MRPDITPRQGRRSALSASGFTAYWDAACSSRGFTMLVAEIAIPETAQSPAARSGREFLAATALMPAELDEVLSEIALLSMDDAGEPRWQVQQLGPADRGGRRGRLVVDGARREVLLPREGGAVVIVRAEDLSRSPRLGTR